MIKNLTIKLIYKILQFDKLVLLHETKKQQLSQNNLLIGESTRVYPESRILNFSKKKENIQIGKNSHIRGDLVVFNYGGNIKMGDNCFLGEGSRIWSDNSITIGDNVMIAHNVNIIDTNSHETDFDERRKSFLYLIEKGIFRENREMIKSKPIYIEDNVWINFNCIVLKGVRIGKGAIIGAGSVVLNDVPPFTFWAGNPAKFISNI